MKNILFFLCTICKDFSFLIKKYKCYVILTDLFYFVCTIDRKMEIDCITHCITFTKLIQLNKNVSFYLSKLDKKIF